MISTAFSMDVVTDRSIWVCTFRVAIMLMMPLVRSNGRNQPNNSRKSILHSKDFRLQIFSFVFMNIPLRKFLYIER